MLWHEYEWSCCDLQTHIIIFGIMIIFTHADDKDKENVNKVCQDHNLIFNLGERRQES